MANFEIYIAATASTIIAIATVINTYIAIRNRNKIQAISVNIDGKMDDLIHAAGLVGEAKGVAQERQESRDRGGAP